MSKRTTEGPSIAYIVYEARRTDTAASTKRAIAVGTAALGGETALASRLGVSVTSLRDAARGRIAHVSLRLENRIRAGLWLPPLPVRRYRDLFAMPPAMIARGLRGRWEYSPPEETEKAPQ